MNNKWKKSFLKIAIGQTVSLIGSSAVQFALIWWLAIKTDSPFILSMAGLVACYSCRLIYWINFRNICNIFSYV